MTDILSSPFSTARLAVCTVLALFVFAACDSGSNLVDDTPDDAAPPDDPAVTSTIHETTIGGVTYQTEILGSSTGVGGAEKFVHRIDYVPQPTSTTYTQTETLTWSFTSSATLSVEAAFEAAGVGGMSIGGSTSYSRTFTQSEMASSSIEIDLDTGQAAEVFASATGRYYNIRQRTCDLFGCSDWQNSTLFAPEGVQLRVEIIGEPSCVIVQSQGEWCGPIPVTNRIQIRLHPSDVMTSNLNSLCGYWSGGQACQLEVKKNGSVVWNSGVGRYYTSGSVTVQEGICPASNESSQCGVSAFSTTIIDD